MILDVGSGPPQCHRGDINVDRYRFNREAKGSQLGDLSNEVDVIAVGEYLPFKDLSVDKVVSNHAIEHSSDAGLFISELVRVSKSDIEITCPHRMGVGAKGKFHRSYISFSWLADSAKKLHCEIVDSHPTLKLYRIGWFYLLRVHDIYFKMRRMKE